MFTDSEDIPITVGRDRKYGIYEWCPQRHLLARRVEMPHWLDAQQQETRPGSFLEFLRTKRFRYPTNEIGESRGHIFLRPDDSVAVREPMVGLDVEIWSQFLAVGSAQQVVFVIYAPDYREIERWIGEKEIMIREGVYVPSSPPFMEQMMVPLPFLQVFSHLAKPHVHNTTKSKQKSTGMENHLGLILD
jgi:hypothetical protein